MRFPSGALQRELDKRGVSQEDFAKIANVSPDTIYRGNKGAGLKKQTYSKIVVALSVVPVLELPEGMRVPA
jgi:predicted transcriptional regulator